MSEILFICMFFCIHDAFSQDIEYAEKDGIEEFGCSPEYMPVYQLGNYEGKWMTILTFFPEFIEYPLEYCDSVRKYVLVKFDVETNGEINNIKVLKGLNTEMDKEAVRVVRLIKCVRPAFNRGKAVKYQETIPVSFCKDKLSFSIMIENSGQIRLRVSNKTNQQLRISDPRSAIPVVMGNKPIPEVDNKEYLNEVVILESGGIYETSYFYPIQKIIRRRKRTKYYIHFEYRGKIDDILLKRPVISNIVEYQHKATNKDQRD